MDDPAAVKAAAIAGLDEVAKALKRQLEANKWALREVRRTQATLVGIQVNTQLKGEHSVTNSHHHQETPPDASQAA